MNVIHPSEHSHATTTEELIVQYLDGELVRKELETMLFERLAQSAEARMLLREYLTVRGAIRSSLEDERFHLSSDLDARTRTRIEQMLEQGILEPAPAAMDSPAMNFEGDAPAVRTNAAERRLKVSVQRSGYRWSLKPGIAVLALLLAIGTTWFLTRTTSTPQMAVRSNSSSPLSQAPTSTATNTPSAPIEQYASANTTTKPGVREVIRYVRVPSDDRSSAKHVTQPAASIAQNAPAASSAQPAQPEADDPAAIMISHRYAKILGAEEKHEIVVSSQDRL